MTQIPASILTLVIGVLVTLASLWIGQNHGLLPVQASAQAPYVDNFFNVMVTIGAALFIVVQGAIVLFAIVFRQRPGDETDGVAIEGNVPLEIFWTAIPAIIVIGLGIYSVDVYEQMGGFGVGHMADHVNGNGINREVASEISSDVTFVANAPADAAVGRYGLGGNANTAAKADLTVDVTGMQYAWIFNYPESGIISGELHVPVGQDVQLNISATDVIHSFWVPQFRIKQDAIPGEKTELRFTATKIGSYPIVCTELCGAYHGSMRSTVIVHEPTEFATWVQQNQIAQGAEAHGIAELPSRSSDLTASEFLAPHATAMGMGSAIDSQAIAQLHHP